MWRAVLFSGLSVAAVLGLAGIWIDGHPADCHSQGCWQEIRDARNTAKNFWYAAGSVLVITLAAAISLLRRS